MLESADALVTHLLLRAQRLKMGGFRSLRYL